MKQALITTAVVVAYVGACYAIGYVIGLGCGKAMATVL